MFPGFFTSILKHEYVFFIRQGPFHVTFKDYTDTKLHKLLKNISIKLSGYEPTRETWEINI